MRSTGLLLFCLVFSTCRPVFAQTKTKPVEGVRENTPQIHVFHGCTIWLNSREKIDDGILVLRDGLVDSVGDATIEVPAEAKVWDATGRVIFPGFIEIVADPGVLVEGSAANTHWNSSVRPERRVASFEALDEDILGPLRETGFTTAHQVPTSGIFRGQSCLIHLGRNPNVVGADLAQCVAFERSRRGYPGSLMGVVALVRQTLIDARWYHEARDYFEREKRVGGPQQNHALDALGPVVKNRQPILFRAGDELDYGRIGNIAKEFGLKRMGIIGNGMEYRQAELLKRMGHTVIVPLDFPDVPPVENPAGALEISLEKLEHWEYAPSNPGVIADAGVSICLTSSGLDEPKNMFWKNVRTSIKRGLAPEKALAALTEVPADMLGVSDRLGRIEPGLIANLTVTSGDIFTDEEAKVLGVWIEGERYEMEEEQAVDVAGQWNLNWSGVDGPESWVVTGSSESPILKVGEDEVPIRKDGENVLILPKAEMFGESVVGEGTARLTGLVNEETGKILGFGVLPGGKSFTWTAAIIEIDEDGDEDKEGEGDGKSEEKSDDESDRDIPALTKYPLGAFGIEGVPEQSEVILIRNATIWTSAEKGRLEGADLLVHNGKIVRLGKGLEVDEGAVVIDGTGKHVTPGLIDCHSHSAISKGVNEGTHAVTCEVRVQDVVDPTDIALYRELAGGLTTANLLHGSANPIGGQNAVIKLRWGSHSANDMLFDDAKPGVKFALGENVKRSNWDDGSDRYPNSRMGVEQIMKDTFRAAQDYERRREEAGAEGEPHRTNLRLEAMVEILNGERIIHIHSYRQDEILMFVRMAQEFGFTVGTFQHILEGYKVADALAEIDAGGSSFSDWWAYKFEVYDAIPHNGALMQRAGVVTSFNSDSNELATRLNTEAAKAVKYGGLSEEDALKFVTINPAIQLRIDERVGSLASGKDADFVVWSGHPLSSFSRAEQTWIDGRKFFDIEVDLVLRKRAIAERERLIAKALPKRISGLEKKSEENLDLDKPDSGQERKLSGLEGLMQFRNSFTCRSDERGLYHNGFDGHTCSAGCCAKK